MLLALDANDSVERYSESLLAAIRVKLDLVKAVASDVALQYLASSRLASVFVTDAGITQRKNASVLRKLVDFAKHGGSVVLGGVFSSFVRPLDMNSFFEKLWGLTWKSGSYHRETFYRRSSHELVKKNASLVSSYSMKALHVKDIQGDVVVYSPTKDPTLERNKSQNPPLFTQEWAIVIWVM
jgi:threonine dehydrogenase-like Zn-dependent dehydrogenase